MRNVAAALLAASSLLLSGCASTEVRSQSHPIQAAQKDKQQAATEEALIASALKEVAEKKSDYKISGADLLEIAVYQEKDLDRLVRVSQNGTVSYPLIGTIKVGGLSLVDAEKAISSKLKDFLVNPQVSVFIKEYGNKKVYVLGEVQKPGSFEMPPESRLTVLEAVSLAGGFTPIAARDRTKVIRITTDGKSESLTIPVSAVTRNGEKEKDIPLVPSDVVYVPQSFF